MSASRQMSAGGRRRRVRRARPPRDGRRWEARLSPSPPKEVLVAPLLLPLAVLALALGFTGTAVAAPAAPAPAPNRPCPPRPGSRSRSTACSSSSTRSRTRLVALTAKHDALTVKHDALTVKHDALTRQDVAVHLLVRKTRRLRARRRSSACAPHRPRPATSSPRRACTRPTPPAGHAVSYYQPRVPMRYAVPPHRVRRAALQRRAGARAALGRTTGGTTPPSTTSSSGDRGASTPCWSNSTRSRTSLKR